MFTFWINTRIYITKQSGNHQIILLVILLFILFFVMLVYINTHEVILWIMFVFIITFYSLFMQIAFKKMV